MNVPRTAAPLDIQNGLLNQYSSKLSKHGVSAGFLDFPHHRLAKASCQYSTRAGGRPAGGRLITGLRICSLSRKSDTVRRAATMAPTLNDAARRDKRFSKEPPLRPTGRRAEVTQPDAGWRETARNQKRRQAGFQESPAVEPRHRPRSNSRKRPSSFGASELCVSAFADQRLDKHRRGCGLVVLQRLDLFGDDMRVWHTLMLHFLDSRTRLVIRPAPLRRRPQLKSAFSGASVI